ncbi:accessory gene regulator ArgB-like protein [Tepidibacter formicigenes]|jgi:accessory gene regulator B|uniref:Accessory gene regulator B n=1 Tax=Tepidibacter formicigenes DSM 15518 TaxID=1123349 RepID=A0A1M6KP34_9FIRM|nr:accessory gene regulator B family protein [Tepidibacter formicigenes]SHJ60676.1 accessory gene regulator B [Tepidibacter formicigenes DSM 15518]
MIEIICNKISLYFKKELNMEEEDREVIEYGLFAVIGSIFKIIMLIILGFIFGILKYILILSFSFALFRIFSGGVHSSTYKGCMIISLSIFTLFSVLIKIFEKNINYNIFSILSLSIIIHSLYMIINFVPNDNQNRIIKDELEKKKFKKLTLYLLVIYVFAMIIAVYFKVSYSLILSGFIGIFLQMISVYPKAYIVMNKFDNKLKGGILK